MQQQQQGYSLLSVTGKTLACIILKHLLISKRFLTQNYVQESTTLEKTEVRLASDHM